LDFSQGKKGVVGGGEGRGGGNGEGWVS